MACTPKKEILLRNYEEACQTGDAVAALRVISEIENEFGDAVDSIYIGTEQLRFEAATAVLEKNATEQAMEQLGNTFQQMDNMGVNSWQDDDEDE